MADSSDDKEHLYDGKYNVVVLAEQALSAADATEVVALHEGIEDPRHYHVLIPCENAAARVETALGALAASEVLAAPPVLTGDLDAEEAQAEIDAHAKGDVGVSIVAIQRRLTQRLLRWTTSLAGVRRFPPGA